MSDTTRSSAEFDHDCVTNAPDAAMLLEKNPKLYVEKFWNQMTVRQIISLKDRINDDGFFVYYSRKVRNISRKSDISKRNERFLKMKALIDNGEFTLAEMKSRNPVLYEELIGQFLTEDAVGALAREEYNKYNTVSQMLLGQVDHMRISELYHKLLAEEGETSPVFEDEVDDDGPQETSNSASTAKPSCSKEEQLILSREFISQMEERFVSGKDAASAYNTEVSVDYLHINNQDDEDAYFDSEEPASACCYIEGKDNTSV